MGRSAAHSVVPNTPGLPGVYHKEIGMSSLIGDILLEEGKITEEQLQRALNEQRNRGGLLGIILVNQKAISEVELIQCLIVQQTKAGRSHEM